jgi:hypothetical protein
VTATATHYWSGGVGADADADADHRDIKGPIDSERDSAIYSVIYWSSMLRVPSLEGYVSG